MWNSTTYPPRMDRSPLTGRALNACSPAQRRQEKLGGVAYGTAHIGRAPITPERVRAALAARAARVPHRKDSAALVIYLTGGGR